MVVLPLAAAFAPRQGGVVRCAPLRALSDEDVKEVGNLAADDEYLGLSMELSELVRTATIESVKKRTREFTGKDDYKVGDLSKELDARVKDAVAQMRGKDEYELGDLTLALDSIAREYADDLTGVEGADLGDLTSEIDARVKTVVNEFTGKDAYEFGDLSREVDRRVKETVNEFTGKDEYEFGDVSRAIEEKRQQWVADFLGQEAADAYQSGRDEGDSMVLQSLSVEAITYVSRETHPLFERP